jgi:hypothetical protein
MARFGGKAGSFLGRYSDRQLRAMCERQEEAERKPRRDEEHEHQSTFFDILRLNERTFPALAFVFAIPNAALRSKKERVRVLQEGLKAGAPDVCIPIPRHGFHGAWIENKSSIGKVNPNQKAFLEFLTGAGYKTTVCRSVDEQIAFIEWYLEIELKK